MISVILLALAIASCGAIPIDNGVIGIPQVQCDDDQVTMIFTTQRPFTGRIFVKGMSDSDRCSIGYRGNTGNQAIFRLGEGAGCNMRRQRRLGPQRGVEQSMTVIVSFHDTFITKVDKAYRCTCFFMEADKVVTADMSVSMLPTTDLFDTARMPSCKYVVRRDSLNGPVATFAKVGENLYHVWECDSDLFGMLVHSCFVDDGTGRGKFQLLDQNGCAIDPVILGDLTYNTDQNQAYVESQAFKFADKVGTYFQCAVSLCMKADGACVGLTPPSCNRAARARFVRETGVMAPAKRHLLVPEEDMDVAAEKIYILDIDDSTPEQDQTQADHTESSRPSLFNLSPFHPSSSSFPDENRVCLSPHGLGLMLAGLLIVSASAIALCAVLFLRQRQPIASLKA